MINTELTLDQLQAVSGGGKAERQAARAEKREERRAERHSKRQFKWGIFCDLWHRPHPADCEYNSSTPAPEQCVPVENQ